jgi:hypothetical protein
MNGTPHALSTSLVLARLGAAVTAPLREQDVLARLHTAARAVGCCSPDVVTAIYVGLKLHLRVCVYGPARDRSMALLDMLATTMVGPHSEQLLHLRGPVGGDHMAQRYAAMRLGDFVAAALDPVEQGKARFILVDAPGDPGSTMQWVEGELAATLQVHGRPGHLLPAHLFLLMAASERPQNAGRCWIAMRTPAWGDTIASQSESSTPPVGYQRHLLRCQITGRSYRRHLRSSDTWAMQQRGGRRRTVADRYAARWVAASYAEDQRGLWIEADPVANTRHALAVWRALAGEGHEAGPG